MCLVTKQICPLRAKRDITVYKILKANGYRLGNLNNLYTPIIHTVVQVGKTMDDSNKATYILPRPDGRAVSEGMIHSYTNKLYAMDAIKSRFDLIYRGVIVECTIPKGTLYYISIHKITICSKKLRINKIIYRSEREP